jgi:transcription termination factor Rho
MAEELADLHLAALRALAAQLGVPRFRMLRRGELVREIESRRVNGEPTRERERLEVEQTEPVVGVLEVTRERYGFLRLGGFVAREDDVYISASQIRRCELRTGDEVSGPAREPRRGERHRALVHVDRVNGAEPVADGRPAFERLTPVVSMRRVALDRDPGDVLTRAVDLLTPLALGQRVLVVAPPRSGRTTLLRGIGGAIAAAQELELIVLLIDERPEEATAWHNRLPGAQLAAGTAELAPAEQVRVAELALERARRMAEGGSDAVLIADSLSRLAVASGNVALVKRLFGSGRDLEEDGAGSLTVIATVVGGAEDDGAAERAVITTENSLIKLDPALAAAGIVPALDAGGCRISNEEELRGPEELAGVRRLRSLLADLDAREAANLLRERIEGSSSNVELLESI